MTTTHEKILKMSTVKNTFLTEWQDKVLAVFRIIVAYNFMLHGTAKLFSMPHIEMFDGLQLFSMMGLAGVLETFGGLLLLVGLFTRPVAFVLSGFMAVAYFMAHASADTFLLPLLNSGELAVIYSFAFLYFVFSGAGAWALDNKCKK
jgi:putative oxidoreductase